MMLGRSSPIEYELETSTATGLQHWFDHVTAGRLTSIYTTYVRRMPSTGILHSSTVLGAATRFSGLHWL